ncbi:MAG: putative collagen-binding domain-containing protein [Planctomycetota bacterium]
MPRAPRRTAAPSSSPRARNGASFEALPFRELRPSDHLATGEFALARPPDLYVLWLPRGGTGKLRLDAKEGGGPEGTEETARLTARWFDPRTGAWGDPFETQPGERSFEAPDSRDWALLVRG